MAILVKNLLTEGFCSFKISQQMVCWPKSSGKEIELELGWWHNGVNKARKEKQWKNVLCFLRKAYNVNNITRSVFAKDVNFPSMDVVTVLTKVVQEQQKTIAELTKKIDTLERLVKLERNPTLASVRVESGQ